MVRKIVWIFLLLAGAASILWALISAQDKGAAAMVAGILSIVVWISYGTTTSHFVSLKRKILRHLRTNAKRTEVISHTARARDRIDIQMALDRLLQEGGDAAAAYGTGGAELASLVKNNQEPLPIQWESLPKSLNERHPCAEHAIYLLWHDGLPFTARIGAVETRGRTKRLDLEMMAPSRQRAQAALDHVLDLARQRSVYRGQVISLEKSGDKEEVYSIKFHDMPAVPREAIVLPAEVMEVVERNVLGLLKHGELLRRSGRATRHGVLFHGPPGTGKTLVTRYLANACAEYTVILLTGRELAMIRESCQLARLLAPSMIVLEDVDLVAIERGRNRHNRILHELLDEMDGLGSKSDCIFLLTTNRPDVLEPALAARPGRVDQAIYFPLPDVECRRRLFACFADGLDVTAVDIEPLLARTHGASPAFIQEMFRKAALMAAERGERSTPLRLMSADFERAIRELVEFGGDLTRNLLGFAPGDGSSRRS
jgi:SpoVK/Ycf46/Vps4 family AAA+-type ATPase